LLDPRKRKRRSSKTGGDTHHTPAKKIENIEKDLIRSELRVLTAATTHPTMATAAPDSAELINTGIIMGIIHVLAGPDHLSALATLCGTNLTDEPSGLDGFLLGVRWGVGHSFGLIVVGGVLILAQEQSEDWIGMDGGLSAIFESLVGVFMLILGCYGLSKAFRNRAASMGVAMASSPSKESLQMTHMGMTGNEEGGPRASFDDHRRASVQIVAQMADVLNRDGDSMRGGSSSQVSGREDVEARIYNAVESLRRNSSSLVEDDEEDDEQYLTNPNTSGRAGKTRLSRSFRRIMNDDGPPMKASSLVHKHAAPENSLAVMAASNSSDRLMDLANHRLCRRCSPGALALAAGVVHGCAGPGGVLGVIPAVQLRDAKLASIYLGTFCLTSILVMGCFAAFYGSFGEWLAGPGPSGRRAGRVFLVEFGSACLSIAVGIVWLVLLSAGKLDEVFG